MSFPPHAKYRDSGVGWLGTVPSDWRVQKFRHTFRESSEKIGDKVVGPMLSVSGYRGIEIKEYDDENRRRTDEDLIGYRIVRPGQLVVNTMWLNYAGLGVSPHEGHVSPAYRSYNFVDEDVDPRFIHYLMRSQTYVQGYTQLLTGVRPNSLQMSRADLMDFPILLPPKTTQSSIADFLERETGKIETLIEQQQQLISLLNEKREALISHAVMKGLDPNVPMRASGIDGWDEIPAHWKITRLKWVAAIRYGIGEPPAYRDEGTPLIRATNVHAGAIYRDGLVFVDPADIPPQRIVWLQEGDIIVVRSGAYTGDSALITDEFAGSIAGFDMVVRPKSGEPAFLEFVLLSASVKRSQIDVKKMRAAQPHLNAEELGECWLALPPADEQRAISRYLIDRCDELRALQCAAEEATNLLRERRSALISAVVTGRFDVRGLIGEQAQAA